MTSRSEVPVAALSPLISSDDDFEEFPPWHSGKRSNLTQHNLLFHACTGINSTVTVAHGKFHAQ